MMYNVIMQVCINDQARFKDVQGRKIRDLRRWTNGNALLMSLPCLIWPSVSAAADKAASCLFLAEGFQNTPGNTLQCSLQEEH